MKPAFRLRSGLAGLALLLLTTVASGAQRRFDIPASPAAQGITRFAQQAGLPVLFPYDLMAGRRTQALRGRFEIRDGLAQLLEGTGLVSYVNTRGQLTIRMADAVPAATTSIGDAIAELATLVATLPQELPEVAVTGTRIERDGMNSPTPVATVTRFELDSLGPVALVDALAQLPHFLNNDTPQTQSFGTSGAGGASHLNLRGIGSVRTLMLLDGRRVVPTTRFGTLDLALLPRSLVRRVDVVTGGASAAYGSDAVSGVVNLVIDSEFRGLRAGGNAGISELGDNATLEGAATFGTRVGEQSTLLLSAEAFRAEGIEGYGRRSWFRSWAAIPNPDPAGPREIIAADVRATGYTYGGLITGGPLAGTQFLPGGVPAPFVQGEHYTRITQSGGSGADQARDMVWILPDQHRTNLFARFTTRPTAALAVFGQVMRGRSRNAFAKDPASLWGTWEATIFRDNAFLPDSIGTRMDAADIDSFRFGRVFAYGELGRTMAEVDSRATTATAGLTWHGSDWSVDGYYQYGHNTSRIRYEDSLRLDRIYRAIDTVLDPDSGEAICRSTLSFPDDGCVPLDVFGQGSASAAARDWVTEGDPSQRQRTRQQLADLTVRGDLWQLPAGTISVATGVSWRLESARSRARRDPVELESLRIEPAESQGYRGLPAAYVGNSNIFERTVATNMRGQYSVWESFGEALVPLVRSLPAMQRVDLQTAVRIARYSGSGAIPAWKLGLDWQLAPSLRLRATRSRDVRAGSLSERFDTATAGLTIRDSVLQGSPVYAVIVNREGNPLVEPEISATTTAGFVLQPAWAQRLSLSVDYYDIRVRDLIAQYGAQTIIDGCAGARPDLCALIDRSDTGLITRIYNRVLNVAGARARGIDLELSWRRAVSLLGGGESVAVHLFANHAIESTSIDATGSRVDRTGQTGLVGGAPRLQANLSVAYERGPVELTLQQRYTSSGLYDATLGPADLDQLRVRAAAYTSLRLGLRLGPGTGKSGPTLFFNVQNLFDAAPPRAPDWGFGGSLPTNESLFDVVGRRFVAGLRYQF